MDQTLFFYDLETTGLKPGEDRIMQFAGQRTDNNLNPIEEPHNYLLKLSGDILPEPSAVLVHGIAPQQANLDGLSEKEFLELFYKNIVKPNTTFVGFNNIRFDDNFLRFLNYRNLYDPYSWSYENGCSRWDILDLVRLTRALRPDGIVWPTDSKGRNTNKLVAMTEANKIDHQDAHDALSDVGATIAMAKLIKTKQPKLYDYLYNLRQKKDAASLVFSGMPFIYSTSHYSNDPFNTSVAVKLLSKNDSNSVVTYNLRYDPRPYIDMSGQQLAELWNNVKANKDEPITFPFKTMKLNRCPAIAPVGVIKDEQSQQRLNINLEEVNKNLELIKNNQTKLVEQLTIAVDILDNDQEVRWRADNLGVEQQIYSGFYGIKDRNTMKELHKNETPTKIREYKERFEDERLKQLLELYLARNYSTTLTNEERISWEDHVKKSLFEGGDNARLAIYFRSISDLSIKRTDTKSQILLEDLRLYGESLIPSDISD